LKILSTIAFCDDPSRFRPRANQFGPLSDHSEPKPDIAVIRLDENRYRDRHSNPADIFLLVEIADATLKHDRTRKAKRYAQANVLEYGVIDVNQRHAIVFRNPQDGIDRPEVVLTATDRLEPLAFPDIAVCLENIFI
jgi:Uma2 family endonuclease